MKNRLKSIVVLVLVWQVRRLRVRHEFQVVAVAGSIGKTSTKFAIAAVLGSKYQVGFQKGNYNDSVTVPLVFFGLPLRSLFNPLAWLMTFIRMEGILRRPYPYDVVVLELGTDRPGMMSEFKEYISADLGILTAISPEHLEYFQSLDAVANEELILADLSKRVLVNSDLCSSEYLSPNHQFLTYGQNIGATYQMVDVELNATGAKLTIVKNGVRWLTISHPSISYAQLYSLMAAISVADELGLSREEILKGVRTIGQVSGRMQILKGIKNTTLIDDTYNASPEAMKGALQTLIALPAPQRIAVLGNMNELGSYSAAAHTMIGELCLPNDLDHIVTIGTDANSFLADAAKKNGCQVQCCSSPYEAGEFIKNHLQTDGVILFKGSQNGVYAEESIKAVLANPEDIHKLVRQSPAWLKKKTSNFASRL